MFDVLYRPVIAGSPVVRLLRTADRRVASDALDAFVSNDVHGGPEFTYKFATVAMDTATGQPADGIPPGRPACPEVTDGRQCGSVRLTWTSGETFRCRVCGAECTGADAGWAPS